MAVVTRRDTLGEDTTMLQEQQTLGARCYHDFARVLPSLKSAVCGHQIWHLRILPKPCQSDRSVRAVGRVKAELEQVLGVSHATEKEKV